MALDEVVVFAKVVRTGSFTVAARELGMPKSTVSRKVAELEERLGARLLQRTTRKLSLTDVGRTYYEHCERIVAELEEAERAVSNLQEAPRGLLRVTAPINFGFLGGLMGDFLERYPDVQLELTCTDRVVDLVEEGFDVAIRAGVLRDSTLIARPLGGLPGYLVASPAYLDRRGRPRAPEELRRHGCLLFGAGSDRGAWRLRSATRTLQLEVHGRLVVNDLDVLREAVLAGAGIAMIPVHQCVDALRARQLERVLPEWESHAPPLHAVYPSTRHLSPKLRAFLDHLQQRMSPPPWQKAAG